jgi:WD40 repeat protein
VTSTATSAAERDPYVGLTYFTEDEAALFFGRDAEQAIIIGNLRAARLTLLYAESGVGKSSLLRAGVAAQIRERAGDDLASRGAPRFVPVVCSSWSEDPVARLVGAIEDAIEPFRSDSVVVLPHDSLEGALELATEQIGTTILLILDQFEEYFLYRPTRDPDALLAAEIAHCVNRPDLAANFLISVREDAYSGVGDLFRGRLSNVYSNFLHLEHLRRSEAREAITKPLDVFNENRPEDQRVTVESELVDAVLAQVEVGQVEREEAGESVESSPNGSGRIDTTYLQLVLQRLWEEEAARGSHVLRLQTLTELGGAAAIIASHLDRAMAQLSSTERDAAAAMFSFLVTKGGTKIALSPKDLAELSNLDEGQVDPVLRRLAAGDVHILRPVALRHSDNGASYEISHDALARPIVAWRTRHREERQAAEREELAQQVAVAERRAARERRRKHLALGLLGVVVTALIATAVAFAVVQRGNAGRLKRVGASNDIARRAHEFSLRPAFGQTAALLAGVEAYRLSPTFNARSQILQMLQENPSFPRLLEGHQRDVAAVAVSSRGILATGSYDTSIRLWDSSGNLLKVLQARSLQGFTGLAFSPDGAVLAGSLDSGQLELWNVVQPRHPVRLLRRPLRLERTDRLECQYLPCEPVAFAPDGKTLAWGGEKAGVWLWDVRDPAHPRRLKQPLWSGGKVNSIAFDPSGRTLALATGSGMRIVPLAGGRRLQLRPTETDQAYAVAWSKDGKLAAGLSGYVDVWDRSGRRLYHLTASSYVNGVAFLSSNRLAFAGADKAVTVWDLSRGRAVGPARQHTDTIEAIAASADGAVLVTGGDDRVAKLWRMHMGAGLASTMLGVLNEDSIAVGRDQVATGNVDRGTLFVLGAAGVPRGRPTRVAGYAPLAFQGHTLAASTGSGDGFVVWDTGSSCKSMPRSACRLAQGDVSPDMGTLALDRSEKFVATGNDHGVLSVWARPTPHSLRLLGTAKQPATINEVAFDPTNSDVVATAGQDGTVRLWSVAAIRHQSRHPAIGGPLKGHWGFAIDALAFSPDGTLLATGGEDQQVVLWSLDQRAHAELAGLPLFQSNSIFSLAFSPDGKTLAVVDGDNDACLYDVKTRWMVGSGSCLRAGSVAAFDQSGQKLLTSGSHRPVVAWDALLWTRSSDAGTDKALAAAACRLAGRNLTAAEWQDAFGGTPLEGHRHRTCPAFPLP